MLYNMHSRRGHFLNQTVVDTKAGKHSYLGERGAWRPPGGGRGLGRDNEVSPYAALGFLVGNGPDWSHGLKDRPWLGTWR